MDDVLDGLTQEEVEELEAIELEYLLSETPFSSCGRTTPKRTESTEWERLGWL